METIDEQTQALRLLDGLENGRMSAADAAAIAEDIDPVLVYVIVSFLREVYPISDPVAGAVLERVVQLTSSNPVVIRKHREGGQDSVSVWFEGDYSYGEFRGRGADLVRLIVDKLES